MTGANHVLTGALIGAVITQPVVALPLALGSHFALDSLPHFGFADWQERKNHKYLLETILAIDLVMLMFVVSILLNSSANWLIIACAFTAVSPDLVWVYRFVVPERFGRLEPRKGSRLTTFHKKIQKHEFPKGYIIEFIAFAVLVTAVVLLV